MSLSVLLNMAQQVALRGNLAGDETKENQARAEVGTEGAGAPGSVLVF